MEATPLSMEMPTALARRTWANELIDAGLNFEAYLGIAGRARRATQPRMMSLSVSIARQLRVLAGKHAARTLLRAQILLAADAGASDEEIAISIGLGGSTEPSAALRSAT
jgi:hypothetical protein